MNRRCIFLIVALLSVARGAALAETPQRVVSPNLCVDPYLLALADRGQIAALTQFSQDRHRDNRRR